MSLNLVSEAEDLKKQFSLLNTREDVAKLLDIDESRLIYYLYIVPRPKRYLTFQIPKKSGGVREIRAPAKALKIIQRKLNQVLQAVYRCKGPVHGFVIGKSIVTNARLHSKHKYVFNIDLKDFFPSINFGRVRGMFMAAPYNLNPTVATILAQICCSENQLPQGAPTSPIISNMICAKMDSQLMRLATKHKCIYSRYADDLTFSTSTRQFPQALGKTSEDTGQLEIGEELNKVIRENGFEINPAKLRLQTYHRRQEVTGLTANRFPNVKREYIRQIRAMLHAWKKFGLEAAEKKFPDSYNGKHRYPGKGNPSFKQVLKGRIEFLGMVRGKSNHIYLRFSKELAELAPEFNKNLPPKISRGKLCAQIMTEGKTDWKHLKSAFEKLNSEGRFEDLEIKFEEYDDSNEMGDTDLLNTCRAYSKRGEPIPIIFIFDRDNPRMISEVSDKDKDWKNWNNNVFSFAIPVPDHRQDFQYVSIELYYKDSDLKRKDKNGRRLFLSNEFHRESGRHLDLDLNTDFHKLKRRDVLTVISDAVYNKNNENVALSKDDFAQNVLSQEEDFRDTDFSAFARIFDIILSIVQSSQS